MFITDDINAIAARKGAIDFHARRSIKSLNDLTPHSMAWAELCSLEKEARKEASAMLDRMPTTTDEQRINADHAVDGFTGLLEAIREEKDERGFLNDK